MTALHNQVALITGASRGIGRAIALELATHGAHTVVTARSADDLNETVKSIKEAGGSGEAIEADLINPKDLERLSSQVNSSFGNVDILVNNAAYIGDAVFESFWEMTIEDWQKMMTLNVNVPWALTKLFAPGMKERGRGLIVNLTSSAAHFPQSPLELKLPKLGGLGAAYPTSKAALHQKTVYLGNELRASGITLVGIEPGFTRSESAEIMAKHVGADISSAQPVEITARAIGHIASLEDRSAFDARVIIARDLVDEFGLY